MNNLNIYCDATYLASLVSSMYADDMKNEFSNEFINFRRIQFDIIQLVKQSTLNFSDTPEEFAKIVKKYHLINLLKQAQNGYLKYSLKTNLLEKQDDELIHIFENDHYQSFLMLNNHEESQKISEKYGVIPFPNLTVDRVKPLKPLFSILEEDLQKKESLNGWNFLTDFVKPCNSIIIADNYLLKTQTCIDNNLDPLLKELFYPMRFSKMPIELVLFCKTKLWDHKNKKHIIIDIETIQDEIERSIHYYYPEIILDVQIVAVDNDCHDRWILSNHYMINSGGGFDLVNNHDPMNSDDLISHESAISGKYPQYYKVNSEVVMEHFQKRIKTYKDIATRKSIKVRCRLFDLVD